MDSGPLSLVVMVLSGGLGTVFLRAAILEGGTDQARFFRALFQTVLVVVAAALVFGLLGRPVDPAVGVWYAALNGLFGGCAFILFTKGLETVEASTAKPVLVVSTGIAVVLGVLVLGESLTARKLGGILLVAASVLLLSAE